MSRLKLSQWVRKESKEAERKLSGKTVRIRKIEPMLPVEGEGEDIERLHDYDTQRKYDGTRCLIYKIGNHVEMWGRSYKNDYSELFPEIVNDLRKLPVYAGVFDSELTFFKKETDQDVFLTALASPETKRDYLAKAMIFDVIWLGDERVGDKSFRERMKILKTLVPTVLDEKLKHIDIVKTVKKGKKQYYQSLVKLGGEGVVLKHQRSPYREGRATDEWIKVKHFRDEDCVVVGYTEGTGRRKSTFGSLVLGQYVSGGTLRYVGKVGTGLNDALLVRLKKKLDKLKTKRCPLVGEKPSDVKAWVKPKLVVTVKYYERTKDGILRFPKFDRIRYDKLPSECVPSKVYTLTKLHVPKGVEYV